MCRENIHGTCFLKGVDFFNRQCTQMLTPYLSQNSNNNNSV